MKPNMIIIAFFISASASAFALGEKKPEEHKGWAPKAAAEAKQREGKTGTSNLPASKQLNEVDQELKRQSGPSGKAAR